MTILYKVQSARDSNGHSNGAGTEKCVLSKISTKNVVAYCVGESDIFVADIVTPWQYFKVCSSKAVVSLLDWNYTGELLLVGYKGGNVEVWSTRQQLLNSWQLLYRANFPSEDIIDARFFHNGKNLYFHTQKKDLLLYADKFERLEFRPTLANFGGAAVEGCMVVTASGLLGVFVIPKLLTASGQDATQQCIDLPTNTHSLGLSRSYIASCCMAYCPSGSLKIAVNCGWREQLIHCFKVSVKMESDEVVAIKCEALTSVFLNPLENRKLSQLRWAAINNEDIILVSYNCGDAGSLEQWTLTKKHQSVHKLLQKNKTEFIQTESWENTSKLHFNTNISEMTLSKMLSDNFQIFVILRDNSVQMLEPGLKKVGVTMFECLADDRQAGVKFVTADVTQMNQILLIFDNHAQMYAMQVPNPHVDKSFKLNVIGLQVALLEYCIISGIDASDILMLSLPNLDMLIEKLTDNFSKQPAFTRHFYYSNFLSLKSNMCRIQSRQHDFDNLIILHSISITFKSLLRPSDLGHPPDKGPADNLAIILSEPCLPDVDKVLPNLDAKDFTVEPITLQSLQQLIQWVADLALNILHRLPEEIMKAKHNKKQGYDISRDIVAIGSIREILVMIRIWGLLNAQCLPIYTKSVENLDVLSILFRLLTRLAQNINEPDEMLLDECSSLSTQVLIPQRQFHNPTTLLNSHMAMKSLPLIFTTSVEPVSLQDMQVDEVVFANNVKDGVGNLHLGSRVHPIRRCVRCGFVNSIQRIAKTSALKSWFNRWVYCHCGGFWKMD